MGPEERKKTSVYYTRPFIWWPGVIFGATSFVLFVVGEAEVPQATTPCAGHEQSKESGQIIKQFTI